MREYLDSLILNSIQLNSQKDSSNVICETVQSIANLRFNSDPPNFPLKDLRFVGLLSMIDPPRPGVPHAVQTCQSAGIKAIILQ